MKPLLLALCLLPIVANLTVQAEDLPARKAGLWEIETSASGKPGRKMKQCVDANTGAEMLKMGEDMGSKMGAACKKGELRHDGDKILSDSECTIGHTKITTNTVFSGDFNSEYSSDVNSKYDPPMMGISERKSKINARWLGPCEANQKPGDIIMPNGSTMNMSAPGMAAANHPKR